MMQRVACYPSGVAEDVPVGRRIGQGPSISFSAKHLRTVVYNLLSDARQPRRTRRRCVSAAGPKQTMRCWRCRTTAWASIILTTSLHPRDVPQLPQLAVAGGFVNKSLTAEKSQIILTGSRPDGQLTQ